MIRRKSHKNPKNNRILKLSRNTRRYRRIHYYLGLSISLLLLISAGTGILLGFKKEVDALQPPTQEVENVVLSQWLSLSDLSLKAHEALNSKNPGNYLLDKMDVRPEKGIVKVIFMPDFWEVQVNGATGEILSVERRYSDLIEKIHDGSIISDSFKLISMNILGVGVLVLVFSGLWLWYGPFIIRKIKHLK